MSSMGPRAINCTSCGAGQDVLGGGRIKVHVCAYCGAALDASANFEVLTKFAKAQDISSPFVPGMVGEIDGITWTVIGSLAKSETWEGETYRWFEHQLYSETHGYAWLSVEEGHLVFTRRMRGETRPGFVTLGDVERSNSRPSARVMDNWIAYGELDVPLARRMFRYHESGVHRIDKAVGSFTWLPKVGERDRTVMLTRETEALNFVETASGEREVSLGRILPAKETYESFEVPEGRRPWMGMHVLEPYLGWVHEGFVKMIVGAFAVLSLALGLVLMVASKERLGTGSAELRRLPVSVPFTAPGDSRLIQVQLTAYPENGWSGFEVEIVGPNGEPVGYHDVGIQRYSGRDSEGAWSEGSSRGYVTFRPEEAGDHRVNVSYIGFEPWSGGRNRSEPAGVEVLVSAKRGTPRWPLIAGGLFALLFVATSLPKAFHKNARAALSDWEDEDDD